MFKNRDFIFESQKLDILFVYAYIINRNISKIFVRNDTDRSITLIRKVKLEVLSNYKATEYFIVDLANYNLAIRASKRSSN